MKRGTMLESCLSKGRRMLFIGGLGGILLVSAVRATEQPRTTPTPTPTPTPAPMPKATFGSQAEVRLVDGTIVAGQVTYMQNPRVLTLISTTREGRREVNYLSSPAIRSVVPVDGASLMPVDFRTPLTFPVTVSVFTTGGKVVTGLLNPGTPAGTIGILSEETRQVTMYPVASLFRIQLVEGSGGTDYGHPRLVEGQVKPGMSVVADVTLRDGATVSGVVSRDPYTRALTVYTETEEGRRELNILAGYLVAEVAVRSGQDGTPTPGSDLKTPVAVVLYSTAGMIWEGTLQPGSPPGTITIVPKGGTRPLVVPLVNLARIRLVEGASTLGTPVPGGSNGTDPLGFGEGVPAGPASPPDPRTDPPTIPVGQVDPTGTPPGKP